MKSRIIKLFRKAAFLGYYVLSRLFIPIIYNYAYRYGELTYLSREDFLVWEKAMSDLLKEYCLVGYNLRHRIIPYTFAMSKIEVVRKTESKSPHIPIVVLCVKNDLKRVRMLVEHYRQLGIEKIALLDNDSNDGTYEWLKEQSDIDLFRCRDRYQTYAKEGWINRIISHYGFNRWYILTDSDELCTYIGMEEHTIADVTAFAEKNKIKRIKGLTIDMYADKLYIQTDDIQRDYRLMDYNTYFEKKARVGAIEYDAFYGGPRYRLMKSMITLSKWPLVYWEKGMVTDNAHYQFPHDVLTTNDCYIGILHYKFMNTDWETYKNRAKNNSGFSRGIRYKEYMDDTEDYDSFMYEDSTVFTGSESLEKISLISRMQFDETD